MKINSFIFLMLTIFFINGCTSTRKMELTSVASPDQKTDPYGAVVSKRLHMVSMSPYKEISYMRDNAIFYMIVENHGETPLTISNENISVIFEGHDKKHTVKKLEVLSAREFMQDVEYEYRKKMITDQLEIKYETDDIKTISMDENQFPVNFNVVFPPRSSSLEPHESISPFTESPKSIPSEYPSPSNLMGNYLITQVFKIEGININMKTLWEILPNLILNKETIMPRDSISVLISCRTNEIPRGIKGDFKITVSIDGEKHVFTFTRN